MKLDLDNWQPQAARAAARCALADRCARPLHLLYVDTELGAPLTIDAGRALSHGAALASLWEGLGRRVERAWLVPQADTQRDTLALSVWLRYLELCGECLEFPEEGLGGDYIWDLAASLHREQGNAWHTPLCKREANVAAWHALAITQLGAERWHDIGARAAAALMADKQRDVRRLGWGAACRLPDRSDVSADRDAVMRRLETWPGLQRRNRAWIAEVHGRAYELVDGTGQRTALGAVLAHCLRADSLGGESVVLWRAADGALADALPALLAHLDVDASRHRCLEFAPLRVRDTDGARSAKPADDDFISWRELRTVMGESALRATLTATPPDAMVSLNVDPADPQRSTSLYAAARAVDENVDRLLTTTPGDAVASVGEVDQRLLRNLERYQEHLRSAAEHDAPDRLAFWLQTLAEDVLSTPQQASGQRPVIELARATLRDGYALLDVPLTESR